MLCLLLTYFDYIMDDKTKKNYKETKNRSQFEKQNVSIDIIIMIIVSIDCNRIPDSRHSASEKKHRLRVYKQKSKGGNE